jgi:hypothetical protein
MRKQPAPKTIASDVSKRIVSVAAKITKLQEELASFGVKLSSITRELFIAADPTAEKELDKLIKNGVTWDHIQSTISACASTKAGYMLTGSEHLNQDSNSRDISHAIKRIIGGITRIAKEITATETAAPGYISRDVFLAMYSDEKTNLEYLETIGISWFQLIMLSGLDYRNYLPKTPKKIAAVQVRQTYEMFGVGPKYLALFQRLICYFVRECPGGLNKIVAETLGRPVIDDKFYRNMISNLSNLINYLKLIE